MDPLLKQTLSQIESTVELLASRVNPPKFIKLDSGPAFRYKEKNIHQAIVQKLARVASGLNASSVLLESGYVQELGALQRMLDEFNEDIVFLSLGVIYDDISQLHVRYLDNFYMEEFEADKTNQASDRAMIPRKKIRAYCANSQAGGSNPSTVLGDCKVVSSAYSGFVHGASTHIMDMYGGNPAKYHLTGMLGTPRIDEHEEDIWNNFYRSMLSCAIAAKAFGDEDLYNSIRAYRNSFETYWERKFNEKKILTKHFCRNHSLRSLFAKCGVRLLEK